MSDFEAREGLEERMDALARRYAETQDEDVRAQVLELSRCLAELKTLH